MRKKKEGLDAIIKSGRSNQFKRMSHDREWWNREDRGEKFVPNMTKPLLFDSFAKIL